MYSCSLLHLLIQEIEMKFLDNLHPFQFNSIPLNKSFQVIENFCKTMDQSHAFDFSNIFFLWVPSFKLYLHMTSSISFVICDFIYL